MEARAEGARENFERAIKSTIRVPNAEVVMVEKEHKARQRRRGLN